MINAKVRIFNVDYPEYLEDCINDFLKTIDVRQIIKTEYSNSISIGPHQSIRSCSAIIYYVEQSDIRDVKIESMLEIK